MTLDPRQPIAAYDANGNLSPIIIEELSRPNSSMFAEERRSVKLMLALIASRGEFFLFLQDDAITKWWQGVVAEACKRVDARRVNWLNYRTKRDAYLRLTAEERRILGIRKPTKPTTVDPCGVGDGPLHGITEEESVQV